MLTLSLIVVVTLLDQVTKELIRNSFSLYEQLEVIPGFFQITYIRNTGAAWGMLAGAGGLLTILSIVMIIVLVSFRRHIMYDSLLHKITFSLMISGIVGNLIDRVRHGYVVDFLDFFVGTHHFPAFNVADSAICIGVALYIYSQTSFCQKTKPEESAV
ncbi:signal peptidase II [bacterium B17]|nr:signal peptidase II [bacterium B17]